MARCPFAVWRPLPESSTQPRIDPRVLIFHSAAGNTSSLWNFFRHSSDYESHFFIKWDGVIEQYMDTTVRADANRNANAFAISVETEDDGDPDRQPWSAAQLDASIRLAGWVMSVHPKVERRLCPRWDASGIGYHTLFGAPSPWTPVNKSCPGTVRIQQFRYDLLPRIINPSPITVPQEDLLMAAAKDDNDARKALIRMWFHDYLGRGMKSVEEHNLHLWKFAVDGADACLTGIVDSAEARALRTKRGW